VDVGLHWPWQIEALIPSVEQHSSRRQEVLPAAAQPLPADMSHLGTTIHPKRNRNQIDGVCNQLNISTGALMTQ
tara:strand:- start:2682 stop:2903 length:222 start_codon:yes stop_codon:yes gene_type:complete